MDNQIIDGVTLNYTFYSGEDLYSDGEIEDTLLEIVQKNDNFDKILATNDNWAILYHLSKIRENIVSVMDIKKTDSVLEIGSGCGAITGALASMCSRVDCIELSSKRSFINAHKNKEYNNIEIFVGNFEEIDTKKKYDVITLIGVLEYAPSYIHDSAPFDKFLERVRKMLKKNGVLYIAIENRLGLKYFAGCFEDHTPQLFEGIEGYPNSNRVKTFSRSELQVLLQNNGFSNIYFYYPYPDYKLPNVIFSDEYLPQNTDLLLAKNFDRERVMLFDEQKVLNNLSPEDFKIFSNSFLVEAR